MMPDERFEKINKIAAQDPVYQQMCRQCISLEFDASDTISKLPLKSQDLLWAYILHCEEMSQYVLSLACKHMHFSEEKA